MNYNDYNDNELLEIASENEEASKILFEKYKPLITGIAKKRYNPNSGTGLDLNDLISEGMIGFSIAIDSYKEGKDACFFTYAKTCIERKIKTAIISSNRLKHRLLNESVSMEEDEESNFGLKKVLDNRSLNPETLVVSDENIKELYLNLDKQLSDFERRVFELRKSGFEIVEIADILDKDYKSVDNSLQRIKSKIKSYLKEKED